MGFEDGKRFGPFLVTAMVRYWWAGVGVVLPLVYQVIEDEGSVAPTHAADLSQSYRWPRFSVRPPRRYMILLG